MATSLAVVGSPVTLYAIEEHLAALVETDAMVTPDMEEAFIADLTTALRTAADNRDRVANFCAHLESLIGFADAEIRRLEERKSRCQRTLDAIEGYVMRVIRNLYEPDARGRYPKLEGNTTSMSLRALPSRVEYLPDGESQVPTKYKTLTIKLPAERWEQLLDSLDMETAWDLIDAVKKAEASIDKRAVKVALEAEVSVPGAYLDGATAEDRRYTLVRK